MFPERAAACAPLVDRAVIAVHEASPRLTKDELDAARAEYGVESVALLPDLAPFFAGGDGDLWVLGLRYRYAQTDGLGDFVEAWRSSGLLIDERPSDRLVGFSRELLRLRAEVAAHLWDSATAALVADIAFEAVDAAAGPLVDRARRLRHPLEAEARCHHSLTLMRYGRHDAHAAAWSLRHLTGPEMRALAAGSLTTDEQSRFHALEARGLVDPHGVVTALGRELVDEIERDTNVWSSPMMVAIGDRWDEWMAGLDQLAT